MTVRVLALTPFPVEGPSSRQRVHSLVPLLARQGVAVDAKPFLSSRAYNLRTSGDRRHPIVLASIATGLGRRVLSSVGATRRYDAVWVQRQAVPALHRLLDPIVLPRNLPVVLDIDDAVYLEYPIDHLIRRCTAVTVGNEFLRDHVLAVAPDVECIVVPTSVDTSAPIPQRSKADWPVVGWIGTASTYRRYLRPMLDDLVRVAKANGAVFRVVASAEVEVDAVASGAEFRPWSLATANDEVASFDVGVMPLSGDEYSQGKCAFKLIEYGLAGIASVGSDVGANRDVIVHGETGLLASTDAGFVDALRSLVLDAERRRAMGRAARARIERHFNMATQADVLAGLFLRIDTGDSRGD